MVVRFHQIELEISSVGKNETKRDTTDRPPQTGFILPQGSEADRVSGLGQTIELMSVVESWCSF